MFDAKKCYCQPLLTNRMYCKRHETGQIYLIRMHAERTGLEL